MNTYSKAYYLLLTPMDRWLIFTGCLVALMTVTTLHADVILTVTDPTGTAAQTAAPICARIDLAAAFNPRPDPARLRLKDLKSGEPVPVQLDGESELWWLMPPGEKGERRFQLSVASDAAPALFTIKPDSDKKYYDLTEGTQAVLRYNHDRTPVPPGIDPKFERGDYIFPMFGPNGENLTDDYPKDHPHHRGVNWSWPVTRFGSEVRDIWAVRGVWARPVVMRRSEAGPVMALLEAENAWKWNDQQPIVREEVKIRVFRQSTAGRCIDIQIRLTALADGVAIGGRTHGGYGGFGLRAAPVKEQAILHQLDPAGSSPRRSWIDYSGIFAGGKTAAGVAIFEHPTNPDYPSEHRIYPNLNCVMPAFPGEREVPLSKEKPLVLNHRLWIHADRATEAMLADVWAVYTNPPAATAIKQP